MSEDSFSRIRLFGKRVTLKEMAQYVANQLLGNPSRKIPPKSIQDISKELDISRIAVYSFRDLAVKLKLLETNEDGSAKLPEIPAEEEFRKYSLDHPFVQDPLIQKWIADLMHRRGSGKEKATWKSFVTAMETICNTLKVTPKQFIIDSEAPAKILTNFREAYMKGEIDSRSNRVIDIKQVEGAMYSKVSSVRDFCGVHGITWRKGVTGIMSNKVVGHGKYSDVRLIENEEINEFEWCYNYLMDKFGLDSDELRVFGVGIESGARNQALLSMKIDFTESTTKKGTRIFHLTAYESKTKHIREGKWTKYVRDSRTQESLRLAKAKGYSLLWDSKNFALSRMNKNLKKVYREMYSKLGKTGVYFEKRPFHAFKHIASQRYLKKSKWNLALTAVLVGSHTIDELKKSYGEMPPEVVAELMEEYFD